MLTANFRVLIVLSLVSGLIGGVLGTFLLVGNSVIAQPTTAEIPSVITAQEFRLVDSKSHIRAMLGFSDDGEPYLHFRDAFGTHRVWIGISEETGLAVRDIDGKNHLVLWVDEEGTPSLVVQDRQSHTKEFHP